MLSRWARSMVRLLRLPRQMDQQTAALNARLTEHQQWSLNWFEHMDRQQKFLVERLAEVQRENQLLLGQLGLPAASVWRDRLKSGRSAPAASAFPESTLCRQADFQQPYFAHWASTLGQNLRYHRKLWEFVFICQALWERGAIRPGARGLGFGVGEEPLTAYFASQDCRVTGTDMAPEAAQEAGWTDTAQHAVGKEALRLPWLCPDDRFEANVEFRCVDMNAIPDNLTGFDFCWSACALEHLGSIDQGLAFIERSIDCLKPGGWAVHTTELNLGSDSETVESGGTVLFRKRDFRALAERLKAKGHVVAPLDFEPGLGQIDDYIDAPPYREEPHLRLALAGFSTTSFGMIVQRAKPKAR